MNQRTGPQPIVGKTGPPEKLARRTRARAAPTVLPAPIRPWLAVVAAIGCGDGWGQTTIELIPSADTSLFEEGALANGAGQFLFTGTTAFGPRRRVLLRFDLSAIPSGATIEGAELSLSMSRTISGTLTVRLHRVLAAWSEGSSDAPGQEGIGAQAEPGEATWDERMLGAVAWAAPGGDFDPLESARTPVRDLGVYRWSSPGMIADVQRWLDDPGSNRGWIVIGNEAAGFGTAKRFDSREHPLPAARPRLIVSLTGAAPPPPAPAPIPTLNAAALLLLASGVLYCGWRRRSLSCLCKSSALSAPPSSRSIVPRSETRSTHPPPPSWSRRF